MLGHIAQKILQIVLLFQVVFTHNTNDGQPLAVSISVSILPAEVLFISVFDCGFPFHNARFRHFTFVPTLKYTIFMSIFRLCMVIGKPLKFRWMGGSGDMACSN